MRQIPRFLSPLQPLPARQRESVWSERLAGRRLPRPDRHLLYSLAAFSVIFIIAWIVGILSVEEVPHVLRFAGALAYYVPVSIALLAPSLGALARRRLDYDPFFEESLHSPVPEQEYLRGLLLRLWRQSLVLAVPALIAALGTYAVLILRGEHLPTALNTANGFSQYLQYLGYFRWIGYLNADNPGALLFTLSLGLYALVSVANYWSGLLMNASILAFLCQRDPRARAVGGLWTAALLLVMGVMLTGRLALVRWLVWDHFTLIFFDGALLAIRLLVTRIVWNRIADTAIDRSRAWIAGERH